MKFADYIQREVVNPVDLEILDKTYNTLEQGHQSAIQATSALQAEMAKLDLNEAESAWRQQKIDEIKSTLENNSYMGNAYHALDDLTRLSGDIASDQGLLGRLQAQQDYKRYTENLDANPNLSEATKEYYRAQNPYRYEERFDENGKEIATFKWTPNRREVNEIPLSSILSQALQWAQKNTRTGTQLYFLDKDGNPTTDASKSFDGTLYKQVGTSIVKLDEKVMRDAIESAINSIPGARESLAQDYEVARWRYKQGKTGLEVDNLYLDDNGQIRTPEQFLKARIEPFIGATTGVLSYTETVAWGEAQKNYRERLAKSNGVASGDGNANPALPQRTLTPEVIGLNPLSLKNTSAYESTAEIYENQQKMGNIIREVLGDDNVVDISKITEEQINNYASQIRTKNPDAAFEYLALYEQIKEDNEFLETIKEGSDDEQAAAFDLHQAIINGTPLPEEDTKFKRRYNQFMNYFFSGDTKAIRVQLMNDEDLSNFKSYYGGEQAMKEDGIYVQTDGKTRWVYIDNTPESKKNFHKYARAITLAVDDAHGLLGQTWTTVATAFNPAAYENVQRVMFDGTTRRVTNTGHVDWKKVEEIYDPNNEKSIDETYLPNGRTINDFDWDDVDEPTGWSGIQRWSAEYAFQPFVRFLNNLEHKHNQVYKQPDITVELQALNAATPEIAENKIAARSFASIGNLTEANKYINYYADLDKEIINGLRSFNSNKPMYVLGENNRFEKVDSKTKIEIKNALKLASENDITAMAVYLPDGSGWAAQLSFSYSTKKDGKDVKESKEIILPSAFTNEIVESWNRNTNFRAKGDIIRNSAVNKPLRLTDAVTMGDIGINAKLTFKNGGYQIIVNDQTPIEINAENALKYRDKYYIWKDTYNLVKAGMVDINTPGVQNIIKDIADVLAIYSSATSEPIASEQYQELLFNALNN